MGQYDLVLLDLGLPGIDGDEVLSRLRRDGALPDRAHRPFGGIRTHPGARSGADDYVVKPCSLPSSSPHSRRATPGAPGPHRSKVEHDGLVIDRAPTGSRSMVDPST